MFIGKSMKKLFKRLFEWAFKEELEDMRQDAKRVKNVLGNLDISVDVHHYSPSWAVISIQGKKSDYIKFINLGAADMSEIQHFLRQFERSKVDCSPTDKSYITGDFIRF